MRRAPVRESRPPVPDPDRRVWALPGGPMSLDPPRVMGVINLTPDSFSDGGRFADVDAALAAAEAMVEAGADLIDVGGESTRPGAREVPVREELRRVLPFLERAELDVPISIDTRKAAVARAALDAGASVVNDVSGFAHDPALAGLCAERRVGVVLMHMRGTPGDMRERAAYGDVVAEVRAELGQALERASSAGVGEERIVLDPGLGFAKDAGQTLTLLGHLEELAVLGRPLLVGPSRKSFLGALLGAPPAERVAGTVAACVMSYLAGARIFRVHDVRAVKDGLTVARAVARAGGGEEPTDS